MLDVGTAEDRSIDLHNKLGTLKLECPMRLRKRCVPQALKAIKDNILMAHPLASISGTHGLFSAPRSLDNGILNLPL